LPDASTLFEKVWAEHVVVPETAATPALLYIDLHLIHEVTTPQAFALLRERGLPVRRPDLTLATMDHSTPTTPVSSFRDLAVVGESAANQIRQMEMNCQDFGIDLLGFDSAHRGIVHVIGPELGASQPGKTIVCGDSHTSTHGAFGALAFGIGTTEVGHVLATQCLLQRKPRSLAVNVSGQLPAEVTAKDLILAIIGEIGVDGGTGHVIEYRGKAIRALDMEARMTICNMSIEAGARAGLIGPDDTTIDYLAGRPRVPQGDAWDTAVRRWRSLCSDEDAEIRQVRLDRRREVAADGYFRHQSRHGSRRQ
jgi:3-isopropylmalate/(R)-2-methylmalate dehydratase large subunit